jgi:hypothetical protein
MSPEAIRAQFVGKVRKAVCKIVVDIWPRPDRVGHRFEIGRHPSILCE